MARLIECDRCGETEKLGRIDETHNGVPTGWMKLQTLAYHAPRIVASDGIIEGGDFCAGCVKALKKWREPIPRPDPNYRG